jgi:hypothetical protein
MRKFLLLTAILALVIASSQDVEAARRKRANRSYTQSRADWNQRAERDGIFARMMELERRKNEFLFGRFR